MHKKLDALKTYLKDLKSVAVAFSSGVDSTFLLKVAHEVLGENVIALTAVSNSFTKREHDESVEFCKTHNIKQILCPIDELKIAEVKANPKDRCYFCKKAIFSTFVKTAESNNIQYVLEGSNMDDLGDYRPGLKAITELKIKSPLRECCLYKDEIRELSKEMGLTTWDKPSFACLASRIPYGEEITQEKLRAIERSEEFLMTLGINQKRVRYSKASNAVTARIEVMPEDIGKIIQNRCIIDETLKSYGFDFVSLDLQGFKSGNLNKVIKE